MLGHYFERVKACRPLVHNITNYVTVNDVANLLLACGASPIMADEPDEVEDITSICGGLNINIGTLNRRSIEAMIRAGVQANKLGHVVVLDPVGVGASTLRTNTAYELLEKVKFDVIKGNISEIKMLAFGRGLTNGVDAHASDEVTEENLDEVVSFIKQFSREIKTIIVVTGAIDLVSDGERCFVIRNGRFEMSQVTGTGCQLSALITALVVANQQQKLESVASAVCAMGVAGETAYHQMQAGEGNATYRQRMIDAIYLMNKEILNQEARYEVK